MSGTRRIGAASNAARNAHALRFSRTLPGIQVFALTTITTRRENCGKPGFQLRWKAQQIGADLKF